MPQPIISIVLPCYNEEQVLEISIPEITQLLEGLIEKKIISEKSFLCFVDDGSKDDTWSIIEKSFKKNKRIKGLKFSRNFGHQSAILAGMMRFKNEVDCTITIDVDLQDNLDIIEKMIADYKEGSEIVYGVRQKRDSDTFFKKYTALIYYKILNKLDVETIYNHADFRLVGSKALNALSYFRESNLFLRGLFPVLGFKTSIQYYDRKVRKAGETKYTFNKMVILALDGITSFSLKPLKFAFLIGLLIIFTSFLLIIWAFYKNYLGETIPGWTSTVIPIYFIGGVQIFFLGIMGEYIGKVYLETKQRPKYIIEREV